MPAFISWRRVMEKLFVVYFGKLYMMAFFYLDTMFCYLDRDDCAGSQSYQRCTKPPHIPLAWKRSLR